MNKKPQLLEHLHYLAKRTFKGHALYLSFKTANAEQKKEILQALGVYEQSGSCQSFDLPSGDKISFFNNNKVHHLMLLVLKIKRLVGQNIASSLMTTYDLKKSFSTLYSFIYPQILTPDTGALHTLSVMQKIPHKPFTFESLQEALSRLEATSITHLIRKQPIYQIIDGQRHILTTSWFIKNTDIRRTLMPSVDMTDNPFFAAALQDATERKVFQKIVDTPDWTGGLNVSVCFLKSSVFKEWCDTHTPEQKNHLFLDLALSDILWHWNDFILLKNHLSEQGYRFIIRLPKTPPFFNLASLPCDYIKVPFNMLSDFFIPPSARVDTILTDVSNGSDITSLSTEHFNLFQGFIDTVF